MGTLKFVTLATYLLFVPTEPVHSQEVKPPVTPSSASLTESEAAKEDQPQNQPKKDRKKAPKVIRTADGMVLERPEPPARGFWQVADWKFWLAIGIYGAALSADVYQSIKAQERCPGCVERHAFLPDRPTKKQFALVNAAIFVGISALTYYAKRELYLENDPWFDDLALLLPATVAIGHSLAARDNARIPASPTDTLRASICPARGAGCR